MHASARGTGKTNVRWSVLSPSDLLLVGFAAALRRAELVALDVAWHREGINVHVARSKTDQLGAGADVPVHASEGMIRRYIRTLRAGWRYGASQNLVCEKFPTGSSDLCRMKCALSSVL